MYDAFDDFLAHDTWHTSHDLDGARFYRAPNTVVREPDFSADAMGDHFRSVKGSGFDQAIDRYVAQAWSVRDYLASL